MRHYFSLASPICHSNGDGAGTFRQLRPIPDHPGGAGQGSDGVAVGMPAEGACIRRPAGSVASVGQLRAASGGGPARRNRRHSRSARDRSSCTRRPRCRTTRTRTSGRTPRRSARHRRPGVDERHPRQDTRPACVLPGTVWGAAPEQNCQVLFGAVLTLKSGRRSPACRGARCPGHPRRAVTSQPLPIMPARGRARKPTPPRRRHNTGTSSAPAQRPSQQAAAGGTPTTMRNGRRETGGQLK
jgi:hypothetical protein